MTPGSDVAGARPGPGTCRPLNNILLLPSLCVWNKEDNTAMAIGRSFFSPAKHCTNLNINYVCGERDDHHFLNLANVGMT